MLIMPAALENFHLSIVYVACLPAFWLRSSVVSVLINIIYEDNTLNAFLEQGDGLGASFIHCVHWPGMAVAGTVHPPGVITQVFKVSLSWGGAWQVFNRDSVC